MILISETDPILKKCSEDWIFDKDQNAEDLEQSMIALMLSHNGRGLAANQTGLLKRVFVIQLSEQDKPFAMFNPKLLTQSDEETVDIEGCLSFPNLFLEVKRPAHITIEYFNKKGELHKLELSDMDARCFLHELDHLNGICFVEKISKLKLTMAKKKQRKYNG